MNDGEEDKDWTSSLSESVQGMLETATESEKLIQRFLRKAARPRNQYAVWYKPQICPEDLEPDFLLYGRSLGLVVIEVKDWTSPQIVSYKHHRFIFLASGREEKRINPVWEARRYVHALMDLFLYHKAFFPTVSGYDRKVTIPIARMVAFPNISREEYENRAFQCLIPWEMVLLKDDLDPAGEILCDTSGERFRKRMSGTLPFGFQGLLPKEEKRLRFFLRPEDRIDLPKRSGMGKPRYRKDGQPLDDAQARAAFRFWPGHQVIKGPPGSGKTLVLVHRCVHLVRHYPGMCRVLLVCFNPALTGYLKGMIQEKFLKVADDIVQVCHFFELCFRILGRVACYENDDSEVCDTSVQEALALARGGACPVEPFDVILVDEGQDLSGNMFRVLLALLGPRGDLVIAQDSVQEGHERRATWKSLGIRATGRTTRLKRVYRNTVEIFDFSRRFLGKTRKEPRQRALLPEGFGFHGDVPEIPRFEDMEALFEFVVEDLKNAVGSKGYKRSEIGVICDDKACRPGAFTDEDRSLQERLLERFDRAGIPAAWVSQDVRAKELFDITTDRVSLISIHSAKGLDFDLVYLVGMDHMEPTEETWGSALSLLYVAITRARYRLVIPYVEETEMVRRMKWSVVRPVE